jgi:hypothetical protein
MRTLNFIKRAGLSRSNAVGTMDDAILTMVVIVCFDHGRLFNPRVGGTSPAFLLECCNSLYEATADE